jgi:hypothetical protein
VYPESLLAHHKFEWYDDVVGSDRVVGPGTMDIKGGTVVALMTLEAIKTLHPAVYDSTEFVLLLNAAEEVMAADFGQFAQEQLGQSRQDCHQRGHGIDVGGGAVGDMVDGVATNSDCPPATAAVLVFEAGTVAANYGTESKSKSSQASASTNAGGDCSGGSGYQIAASAIAVATSKVVVGRAGRAVWQLTADGIEGHAGNGHRTSRNAIAILSEAVVELGKLTDYDKSLTVNVGTFHGGTVVNTVPGAGDGERDNGWGGCCGGVSRCPPWGMVSTQE